MSDSPAGWELTPKQRHDLLRDLGEDFRLGYRLGAEVAWIKGYEAAESDMADAWAGVAAAVRTQAATPTHHELELMRHVPAVDDLQPCPSKCKHCATCWAYSVWWRRGRRPYLGAAREAELERQAVAS